MKRSFTLLELVLVVVIISFLSMATFEAIKTIKIKSFKAKELTRLSLESQIVLDQLSSWLRNRIPATAIGYSPNGVWEYLDQLSAVRPVLEWIAYDEDGLGEGKYSGFVDINRTIHDSSSDYVIHTDVNFTDSGYALIFSGSYDRGYEGGSLEGAFGWHGSDSNLTYEVSFNPPDKIIINSSENPKPKWLYEKYFLTKSAYAVARSSDIDKSVDCIKDLKIGDDNDTLLLFYNYHPWEGKTFCADPNGSPEGNATILMRNVQGFEFREEGSTIRLWIDINKTIPGNVGVHFSKMKVVW